jgi:hypothetical protein
MDIKALPAKSKKSKKSNVKKTAGVAAAAKSKTNAAKTAQPGIIATIMETLVKAKEKKGVVTVNDILDTLVKNFPSRDRASMAITVRAQLSRLPREKDFDIKKVRDGRTVSYAAA